MNETRSDASKLKRWLGVCVLQTDCANTTHNPPFMNGSQPDRLIRLRRSRLTQEKKY